MKSLYATEAVNVVQYGDAVRMVCQFCGRMTGLRAAAGLVDLPVGWSMSPFPSAYVHAWDGSTGALYTCPDCNGRIRRREFPLTPREYLRAAQP